MSLRMKKVSRTHGRLSTKIEAPAFREFTPLYLVQVGHGWQLLPEHCFLNSP